LVQDVNDANESAWKETCLVYFWPLWAVYLLVFLSPPDSVLSDESETTPGGGRPTGRPGLRRAVCHGRPECRTAAGESLPPGEVCTGQESPWRRARAPGRTCFFSAALAQQQTGNARLATP